MKLSEYINEAANISQNTTSQIVEAATRSIVEDLTGGCAVRLPSLGLLEVKRFKSGRFTVLLSAGTVLVEQSDQELPIDNPIEFFTRSIITLLLKHIQVDIPGLGSFHPVINSKGLTASFTPSMDLRKKLEGGVLESFSPEAPPAEISGTEIERMNIERESEENAVYIPPEQPDMVERSIIFEATGTLKEGRPVKKIRNGKKVTGKKKLNNLIYIAGVASLLVLLTGIIFHNNKDKEDLKDAEIVEIDKTDGTSANLLELSEKVYGHKAYWIYIYDFNREQLSSPVNVKSGIRVEIPDISMYYGIDVQDTSEIRKALSVTEVLLNMNNF